MDPNLYGYVLNDPVNLIDPEGLSWLGPIKWVGKKFLKWIGKKSGKDIGDSEIAYPPEQKEFEKDTDGDGRWDFYDPDDDNDGIPDERDADPKKPFGQDNSEKPCK